MILPGLPTPGLTVVGFVRLTPTPNDAGNALVLADFKRGVLKKDKDAFIRISVGGPDKEEIKIDKCKALVQKAIDRL